MHGPEATRIIRSMGYTRPIIGVTGNTSTVDVENFLAAGATKILGKPILREELSVLLAGLIDEKIHYQS